MDQLTSYLLGKYPNNFICGTEQCDILLWGIQQDHEMIPKMITLNVAFDYIPTSIPEENIVNYLNNKYTTDIHFNKMYKHCKELATLKKLNFSVFVYPSLPSFADNYWHKSTQEYKLDEVNFYVKDVMNNSPFKYNGKELVSYIYKVLGKTYTDKGSTKEQNKTIHDYFQFWSRNNLSTYIKKLDCDGILKNNANNKHALIEIKRSSIPPIPQWKPYVNDSNNYKTQLAFSKKLNAKCWLLQHEGKGVISSTTNISFYDIDSANNEKIQELYEVQKQTKKAQYGDYLICNRQEVPLAIDGTHSLNQIISNFINS
jgi:hypothetical protein